MMKPLSVIISVVVIVCLASACNTETKNAAVQPAGIDDYLGQYILDVDIDLPNSYHVSWLEVLQEDGYLDAGLLWNTGSVTPVSNAYLANDRSLIITISRNVVRKRAPGGTPDASAAPGARGASATPGAFAAPGARGALAALGEPIRTQIITSWLKINKNGDKIDGVRYTPNNDGMGVDSVTFTGSKLPEMPPAPDLSTVRYGEPINLFNGKDLTGWSLTDEKSTNPFSAVNGELVATIVRTPVPAAAAPGAPPAGGTQQPPARAQRIQYGNIKTDKLFGDFNLKLEVKIPPNGNSGIYLKGMYEVAVQDSYNRPLDSHNMGAIYSRITPTVSAEKPPDTWQTLDITLCDRHVTVILNGTTIIDNQPVYGPTGGAIHADVLADGPIYLQGDHSSVAYRNIVLTPILK